MKIRLIAAAALLAQAAPTVAGTASEDAVENIIVTGVRTHEPLRLETDPSRPRQPLPAHDGAEYLKTIPGFNIIRKGGTDGDPLFRGMAASRINVLLDGESLLGGCGSRMDPPTAYVFPEAYDRITIIKGPQTVVHGPGNSAATVLFERDKARRETKGVEAAASATLASFGRRDGVLRLSGGSGTFYSEITGTHSRSDNYEDGGGNEVHSRYERSSGNVSLGWTPNETTLLELSAAVSDGEAAYADRMMDGKKFERENIGLTLRRSAIADWLPEVEAQVYYNHIDHVMDNYSLRDFVPTMVMPNPAVSNPDRRTFGGRLRAHVSLSSTTIAILGVDHQANDHALRSTMNQTMMPYQNKARADDASFRDIGIFTEIEHGFQEGRRLIGGLRIDAWKATDKREEVALGMMMTMPNPSSGERRDEMLESGFLRFEQDLSSRPLTWYAGLGHSERFPDYWELFSDRESTDSVSAFATRPEKNTQLDLGLVHKGAHFNASVSLFHNDIDDFILIESNYRKGLRAATVTRNVDATTWGGEMELGFALNERWLLEASIAYTHGKNETDNVPLAQQPPLEGRLSLSYQLQAWSFGTLLRLVDDQNRYAIDQGNVVGRDLGPSDGFAVFSLNGGWKHNTLELTAGIDNLFDATYAEHLSRGGAMLSGFEQTMRVNEPGRIAWVKLRFDID